MGATRIFSEGGEAEQNGMGPMGKSRIGVCGYPQARESAAPMALGIPPIDTQRLRTGLMSFAPPALKRKVQRVSGDSENGARRGPFGYAQGGRRPLHSAA